jgi:hypothetical protein
LSLSRIAAFALAAIVSGVVAMEISTKWINPDLSFWQGRGIAWTGGIIVSALVLAIAAIFMRLVGTSIFATVLSAAAASLLLLILLAVLDGDRLLLAPQEMLFALLWGGFAGLLWYLLRLWLPFSGGSAAG